MAEPQQEYERPSDATEFFSQLGDMTDADAIANSQRLDTLEAWAPTEWMRVKDLDGAMKITAFAFESLKETEDRDSLRQASRRLMGEEHRGELRRTRAVLLKAVFEATEVHLRTRIQHAMTTGWKSAGKQHRLHEPPRWEECTARY